MDILLSLERLGMNFIEGRYPVVPLEQGCRGADPTDRALVEPPDWIDHRMIVRVEDVLGELGVAGDVDLRHALGKNAVEILVRIEIVVSRGHIDVVYVQKNPAIAALHHPFQQLPFVHPANLKSTLAPYF